MKNYTRLVILLFTLVPFLNSCKSSDNATPANSMSPPSWIVGTWYFTPNIPSQGFIVQSDNVIVLTGSSQVDLKDNASKSSGTMIIKELSKSSTVYEIQVLLNGSEYLYYKFTNTSNPTVSSVVMRSMAVSQSVTVSLYKKI